MTEDAVIAADDLVEAMAGAYAHYLRATIGADPRVRTARTVAGLRAAVTACLEGAASPFDIAIERDPCDPGRVNVTLAPRPVLTVTALVRM